jgi:hypothetical protein
LCATDTPEGKYQRVALFAGLEDLLKPGQLSVGHVP